MKFLKKACKVLLYPCVAVIIPLALVSGVFLIYTMTRLPEKSIVRICSYLAAFYSLTVICVRIPDVIRFFAKFKDKNRYISIWRKDVRLRANITLCANVLWNGAYALLQLGMGIKHGSPWYYSLFVYYASLAFMRFFLVKYTLSNIPGKNIKNELKRYRICGAVFLLVNSALSGMILYMIRENRTVRHSEITVIAMATYTFVSLTFAIVNTVKYRRYNSPTLSAAKTISLASSCVSMLTLENTMLTAFSKGNGEEVMRTLFLSISGGAVSAFIIVLAVYMIVQSNKKMKLSEN